MATRAKLHTIALAYQSICAGEGPWIALGNFMHDFFRGDAHRRAKLVYPPITYPEAPTLQQRQWAAFCAGAVEYLCQKYGIACPTWVYNPQYIIEEAWFDFDSPWSTKEHVRAMLLEDTPAPFVQRNVYCGNRVFLNPHEHQRVSLEKQPA